MNKVCPMMSSPVGTVLCLAEKCSLWHDSGMCLFLATAKATDDTALIVDMVLEELKEIGSAIEDITVAVASDLIGEEES